MDVENHNGDQLRPTLASIYQAKKSGRLEDTSVEVLKQQFQSDMIKNGQQHSGGQKMNEKGLHNRSVKSWIKMFCLNEGICSYSIINS